VIADARARGMLVLLLPAYLGYAGGSEGWFQDMSNSAPAECHAYGVYLGLRFQNAENVVWVAGGDYSPPAGSAGETCMLEIMDGLDEVDGDNLRSGHWAPESTSRSQLSFRSKIDLNGVYTYGLVHDACRDARDIAGLLPTFLLESTYENEHSAPTHLIRRQAYESILECGAGQISGTLPIWNFGNGWENALDSPGSLSMEHAHDVFAGRAWYDLAPDDPPRTLLVAGGGTFGSDSWVSAASTADGSLAVVYVPHPAARTITVDLSTLSGALTATWIDPSNGDITVVDGSPFASEGNQAFSVPGDNADGAGDWVLILEAL